MTRQRGFTLYIVLAALLAFVGMAVALKIQSARLESAQAKVAECEAQRDILAKQVEKQNKAVSDMSEAAAKRARIAQAALAKARQEAGSLDAEIARLRGVKPADCAAAVAEVRKGLKP